MIFRTSDSVCIDDAYLGSDIGMGERQEPRGRYYSPGDPVFQLVDRQRSFPLLESDGAQCSGITGPP